VPSAVEPNGDLGAIDPHAQSKILDVDLRVYAEHPEKLLIGRASLPDTGQSDVKKALDPLDLEGLVPSAVAAGTARMLVQGHGRHSRGTSLTATMLHVVVRVASETDADVGPETP